MASRAARAPARDHPPPPTVPFQNCPIATSLGCLGRKWALTILRDIAFLPNTSFSVILRGNPGLLPRTLSLRLRQLNAEGLIEKVPDPAGGRKHTYQLTAQGKDIWPVLTALTDYGSRYHSQQVFEDGRPRGVEETFPESAALMMGRLVDFARSADPIETPNGGRAGSNRGRSSAPPVSDARRRSR